MPLRKRMRRYGAAVGLALVTNVTIAESPPFKPTYEQDTARGGQDYHYFLHSQPLAQLCQMACIADVQCRAWEYDVGRRNEPRCWLKNKVPPPNRRVGNVAGVVRPEGQFQPAPETPQTFQMAIRSSAPNILRCLDVPNGKFTQGARVQLWDCNGGAAQLFTYDLTSHHVMIGTLCVQMGGNGQQGAAVELGSCSSEPNRSWKIEFKQQRAQFTAANGLCLDSTAGRFENGTSMQAWACNGSIAQLWHFTRVASP